MAFQNRIPPVKVELSKENFNKIMEFLKSFNNSEDKYIKELSEQLKEKMLRYSIPREYETGDLYVDVRFYPNEASKIILLLTSKLNYQSFENDYYIELLKNRITENQIEE